MTAGLLELPLGVSASIYSSISYKIIVLFSLNLAGRGPRAYPSLARGYGPGMGLKVAGWAGPGPNIHGLGRAWA